MSKKLTPAVGYVRMSSGHQEKSPAQQREEIKKLAVKHGCRIVRWYTDEKISGDATEKRKDFQRMIRDAEEKGDFAVILCWDQDRFGRFDSIEAGRWIYPLREAGVWLITCNQGQIDWNDFASRMVYSVLQEGKHQFLIDLSKNVLRGRIASAKRGGMIVTPPFGYDRVFFDAAGQLVKRVSYGEKFSRPKDWAVRLSPAVNKQEVETVKWMFDTFAETDCSIHWLVLELNRRNVPTRRGQGWSAVSARYILTHPVYVGTLAFGRQRGGKYHQIGEDGEISKVTSRGFADPPIVVENAHEPLVDRAIFDKVQGKLAERKGKNHKPRHNGYILTGIVRCGHCGRSMCGKSGGSKTNPDRRYYYCPGGQTGRCRTHSIRQQWLDDYVLDSIYQRLTAPETVEAIKTAIHRKAKSARSFKANAAALKSQIATLDRKISKGTENLLLADSRDMDDLSRLLSTWRQERGGLQRQLETTATQPTGEDPGTLARRAIRELKRLREHLDKGSPLKVRAVVKSMVEGIDLWWKPNGKRYRTLAKGVLTFHSGGGVLESSSSIASGRRRWGSAGP